MSFSSILGLTMGLFLAMAPVADALIWLWLLLASQTAIYIILGQDYRQYAERAALAVVMTDDEAVLLARRTVPQLRSRRPLPIIEAQWRWRQAAESYRRFWRMF